MQDRESTPVNTGKVFPLMLLAFLTLNACSRAQNVTTRASTVRNTASSDLSEPASSQLRRLSNLELSNTIQSLFGDGSQLASSLPPDEESLGYTNGYNVGVSQLFLDLWQIQARQLATQAVKAGSPQQQKNASCLGQRDSSACADLFIEEFGKQAFRRPLVSDEKLELKKVFNAGLALGSYERGQQVLIEAILISPSFLYKTAFGSGDNAGSAIYELSAHEQATHLAYALTAFPPDAELMAAADSGALLNKGDYQIQVERLMKSDRSLGLWRDFVFAWLKMGSINSIQRAHPQWSETLPKSFRAETETFVNQVMTEGNGSLIKLLNADYRFADPQLNTLYGQSGVDRRGILTQPAFLSLHAQIGGSSPVRRGFVILQRLFCLDLPPPPPGVAVVPPENPTGTTRDRFAAHSNNASCKACHSRMDPLGFAFENYDGLGIYRSQENGQAVDASGNLGSFGDVSGSFNNAQELIDRMAVSKDVHQCVTKQLFRYVMGRIETSGDSEILNQSLLEAESKDMDLRAALLSIVSSQQFRQRLSEEQ